MGAGREVKGGLREEEGIKDGLREEEGIACGLKREGRRDLN